MEKFTNKLIGFIFVFLMVLCTIASVNSILWAKGSRGRHLYLAPLGPEDAFFQWLGAFVTFFILFNNLIPISLYVRSVPPPRLRGRAKEGVVVMWVSAAFFLFVCLLCSAFFFLVVTSPCTFGSF